MFESCWVIQLNIVEMRIDMKFNINIGSRNIEIELFHKLRKLVITPGFDLSSFILKDHIQFFFLHCNLFYM
jgi:hypothetical protein